jgi:anthranilate synthase component 2
MKILVLDNYDSFVYNLVHIIRELGYGEHMDVIRNDKISLDEVDAYDKILLSPGPGIPEEAGIMRDLIKKYASSKSILGVCLGHQAIGETFGSSLENMDVVLHGFGLKTNIVDENEILFSGIEKEFTTGRYHSWVIDKNKLGSDLTVTAMSEDDRIMGVRHKEYDVRGVQFHPESILTENGKAMMKNWLEA